MTDIFGGIAVAVAVVLLIVTAVNIACWYLLFHRSFSSPWNWRVLAGPWTYCPWDRRRAEDLR